MNILICPDSFKGSATSLEAADYISRGVKKVFPEAVITKLSVADGGEGTVESILHNCPGTMVTCRVTGPNNHPVDASYALLDSGIAIIEMAEASGITLIDKNSPDPMGANTYGTGELILSALNNGCNKIIIGIGGSATTDGGTGMAKALGYRFFDNEDNEITLGGAGLNNLHYIDMSGVDKRIFDIEVTVACDVNNPLYGERGAASVYAPQKGADQLMVEILDQGLRKLHSVVKNELGFSSALIPGAGAAGGLGFGLLTFCKAELQSGITTVIDTINFDYYLKKCDLIITGEGRIDGQSVNGKVPVGIGERAKKRGIPVIVITGGIGGKLETVYEYGISSVISTVNSPMTLSDAIERTEQLMIDAAESVMRIVNVGMNIPINRSK